MIRYLCIFAYLNAGLEIIINDNEKVDIIMENHNQSWQIVENRIRNAVCTEEANDLSELENPHEYKFRINIVDSVLKMDENISIKGGFRLYFQNSCIKFKKMDLFVPQIYLDYKTLLSTTNHLYQKLQEQKQAFLDDRNLEMKEINLFCYQYLGNRNRKSEIDKLKSAENLKNFTKDFEEELNHYQKNDMKDYSYPSWYVDFMQYVYDLSVFIDMRTFCKKYSLIKNATSTAFGIDLSNCIGGFLPFTQFNNRFMYVFKDGDKNIPLLTWEIDESKELSNISTHILESVRNNLLNLMKPSMKYKYGSKQAELSAEGKHLEARSYCELRKQLIDSSREKSEEKNYEFGGRLPRENLCRNLGGKLGFFRSK